MVVDSILPHEKSGPNDHRKDAPRFNPGFILAVVFILNTTLNQRRHSYILGIIVNDSEKKESNLDKNVGRRIFWS